MSGIIHNNEYSLYRLDKYFNGIYQGFRTARGSKKAEKLQKN